MNLAHLEFKKILKQPVNRIAIAFMLLLITALVIFHRMDSPPNNSLKSQKGFITCEKINTVIVDYATLMSNPNNYENGVIKASIYQKEWKPFVKFEKYITQTYPLIQDENSESTKESIDFLVSESGNQFYEERFNRAKERIISDVISVSSQHKLIEMHKQLKIPFWFDYHDGWQVAIGLTRLIFMIIAATLTVILAPVYTLDYQSGMDQLIYGAKKGKRQLFKIKYWTTLKVTTALYTTAIIWVSVLVFGLYGTDGHRVPFQLMKWLSPYELNALQAYAICLGFGYLSCIFFVTILNFISVLLKKIEVTFILGWLILLLPLFIMKPETGFRMPFDIFLDILPTNMMDAYEMLGSNNIYEIFNISILQPHFQVGMTLCVSYIIYQMTLILYKSHQPKGVAEVKL